MQPYLDEAGQSGGLDVKLTCFALPGITEIGFYGTRGGPTDHRFERCFPSEEKAIKAIRSDGPALDFGYSHTWSTQFSADGGLNLEFLGKWAPALKAEGGAGRSVDVTIKYEGVRFRRISDLKKSLAACEDRGAAIQCIQELSEEGVVYTATALVGRMVVTLKTGANINLAGDVTVAKALAFNVRKEDKDAGVLTLESAGDVAIAGVLRESNKVIPKGLTCFARLFPDKDKDGFGDAAAAAVLLASAPELVADNRDCYDQNKEVFPGQDKYFDAHRGDSSFDFNCDGKQERSEKQMEGGCRRDGGPASNCYAMQGWVGEPAACGDTGTWLADCDTDGAPWFRCVVRETQQRRQACR